MEPPRPAKADILHLVKANALDNLRHTSIDDVIFIISVLAIALIALLLINKMLLGNTLQVKRITIPSFFIAIYLALMSLPCVVWFYAEPENPIRYTYFIAMQSVLVTFPMGMFFANVLFRDSRSPARIARRFFSVPLQKSDDDRYAVRYWLVMLIASIGIATWYLLTSSYVPLIGALTSYGEVDASIVRRAIVGEGVAIHYGHALTARFLLPFCLVYSYFMAYLYGGRWRLLFWPTLAVVAFVSALTFDRMFPFSVMLYLVLAVYFKHDDLAVKAAGPGQARRGMSNLRLIAYVVGLLFLGMLVGGLVTLTQFNNPIDAEILKVTSSHFFFNRVLLDPSFMAYIYFEEFANPNLFQYGNSLHILISKAIGKEFYGTISPSFVAELWFNFGWSGVLLGSALVGFVLQLIQVKTFNRKTAPALSLYIVMLLNGAWIVYGHLLATMVISVYLPSMLILLHLKRRRNAIAASSPGIVSGAYGAAAH